MADPPAISEGEFLRLLVRHEQALQAFARVLLPTWAAVEEVLQEASVVMWRKRGQLDAVDGFLPWAKVIVRFEALRHRREFARDRHVFGDEVIEMLARECDDAAEDQREREEAALRMCVEQLPVHQQELVLAPYRGSGEVLRLAERSGRTVNSLYKLLGRIRERLAECVEGKLAGAT